jgi:8-oxo-dGTP diphosphatase
MRRSGDGFVRCNDGHVRWGRFGAAGVVFVVAAGAVDGAIEPLVMLQLRSGFAHEGGTWSCAGGALDEGETPYEGALREASEEVGAVAGAGVGEPRLIGEYMFAPADDWSYTTVVVAVDAPFGESLNFETDAVEWVPVSEVVLRPLHGGFAAAWPHLRAIIAAAPLS